MIHQLGAELQAALVAVSCPIPVVDGPEPTSTTTWGRERIVIARDEDGDSFGPVRSQHKNPKQRMVRNVGGKVTIYAQSAKAGAMRFEHERRAELLLDVVLVALADVIIARPSGWTVGKGKFIQPPDLEKSERPAGAVYELTFTVERGVAKRTWAGDISPEHTLGEGGLTSCTHVSSQGGSENETACGIC